MADETSENVPTTAGTESSSFLQEIINEIIGSPLNLILIGIITFLIYKIFRSRNPKPSSVPSEPEMPKMKKRDFTVKELKPYDGNQPDGRVLIAVNGFVYDVTKGKRFYGPGMKFYLFIHFM
jgi:membrane-associated progesterone receptor component